MSEKKMMDMSENLLFLPSNILKEISDVITKAEVNLLLEDATSLRFWPKSFKTGKKWE